MPNRKYTYMYYFKNKFDPKCTRTTLHVVHYEQYREEFENWGFICLPETTIVFTRGCRLNLSALEPYINEMTEYRYSGMKTDFVRTTVVNGKLISQRVDFVYEEMFPYGKTGNIEFMRKIKEYFLTGTFPHEVDEKDNGFIKLPFMSPFPAVDHFFKHCPPDGDSEILKTIGYNSLKLFQETGEL